MDWDDMRVLLAVARAGTMKRAAKTLGVSYTTVSRRLEALQERTGVVLLTRVGRRYMLTQAGEVASAAAAKMEAHTLELERDWAGLDGRLKGTLRVATSPVVAQLYRDALRGFCEACPDVALEVVADSQAADLDQIEADVVLRVTTQPPEHWAARRLAPLSWRLYGARPLLSRFEDGEGVDEMPWLGWAQSHNRTFIARKTSEWMAKHAPNAQVVCRADTLIMMLTLARAGVGLAFMPTALAEGLVPLTPIIVEAFDTGIWLLTPETRRDTALIRAFTEHIDGLSGTR